jgi:hypothetical protein
MQGVGAIFKRCLLLSWLLHCADLELCKIYQQLKLEVVKVAPDHGIRKLEQETD